MRGRLTWTHLNSQKGGKIRKAFPLARASRYRACLIPLFGKHFFGTGAGCLRFCTGCQCQGSGQLCCLHVCSVVVCCLVTVWCVCFFFVGLIVCFSLLCVLACWLAGWLGLAWLGFLAIAWLCFSLPCFALICFCLDLLRLAVGQQWISAFAYEVNVKFRHHH